MWIRLQWPAMGSGLFALQQSAIFLLLTIMAADPACPHCPQASETTHVAMQQKTPTLSLRKLGCCSQERGCGRKHSQFPFQQVAGGWCEENSYSSPGRSEITLHLWNIQIMLGSYQRCWALEVNCHMVMQCGQNSVLLLSITLSSFCP